jgi:hypothetical protein
MVPGIVQSNVEQNTINNHSSGQETHVMVTTSTAAAAIGADVSSKNRFVINCLLVINSCQCQLTVLVYFYCSLSIQTTSTGTINTPKSASPQHTSPVIPTNHRSLHNAITTINTANSNSKPHTRNSNTNTTNTTSSKQDELLYDVAGINSHSGNIKNVRTLRFTVHWVGYSADETSELSWSDLKHNEVMHLYLIENGLRSLVPKDYQSDYSELLSLHNFNTSNTSHVDETQSSSTPTTFNRASPQVLSDIGDDNTPNSTTNRAPQAVNPASCVKNNNSIHAVKKRGRPRKLALTSTFQHDECSVPVDSESPPTAPTTTATTSTSTSTSTVHTAINNDLTSHQKPLASGAFNIINNTNNTNYGAISSDVKDSSFGSRGSVSDVNISSFETGMRSDEMVVTVVAETTDVTPVHEIIVSPLTESSMTTSDSPHTPQQQQQQPNQQSAVDVTAVNQSAVVLSPVVELLDVDSTAAAAAAIDVAVDLNCAAVTEQSTTISAQKPPTVPFGQHSAPLAPSSTQPPLKPTNKKRPRPIAAKNTSSSSDIDSSSDSGSDSDSSGSDGTDGDDERVIKGSEKHKQHKRPPRKLARYQHNNNPTNNSNINNNTTLNTNPSDTNKRRNLSVKKSFADISSVFLKSGVVHKRSASYFDSESETGDIRAGCDSSSGAKRKLVMIFLIYLFL